jgi:hypothetical protein
MGDSSLGQGSDADGGKAVCLTFDKYRADKAVECILGGLGVHCYEPRGRPSQRDGLTEAIPERG